MTIKKEFKIGIFVILVLVATFVIINVLRGSDIFGNQKEYKGYFYDVETLVPSAPVLVRGYIAGKVDEVNYDAPNDRFEVICSVKKEFALPTDSKMMLYSTSIMGGKGVRILPGTASDIAEDGSVLETGSEVDMLTMLSGQIGPLMEKVNVLLDTVTVTVGSVNQVLGEQNRNTLRATLAHLERTIKNAEELSASLGGKSDKIKEVIDNLNRISVGLVPMMDSLNVSVSNINAITGKLAEAELDSTIMKTNKTVENVGNIVDSIQKPLESLLKDTDDLINAIKKEPKKYLKLSVF